MMRIHPNITRQAICDACICRRTSLDNPGFCIARGAQVDGVEPDAREYECEVCGESGVYGAEELLNEVA